MRTLPFLLLLFLGLAACGPEDCDALIAGQPLPQVKVERLDLQIASLSGEAAILSFLQKERGVAQFLSARGAPVKLLQYTQQPHYDTIKTLINAQFSASKAATIALEMAKAFAHVKHYYPTFKAPAIQGIFTGYGPVTLNRLQDTVLIGLEYFLDFKPPLRDLPHYLFRHFTTEHLTAKLLTRLASDYLAYDLADPTMLNDMLAWGKTYYFVQSMMPCTTDSIILGQTGEGMAFMQRHIGKIWEYFVVSELFYSTDHMAHQKFIEPRPYCVEMAEKCPGMVGRWLGFEIVKSYMDQHPSKTLQDLMAMKGAKELFNQAGFRPK